MPVTKKTPATKTAATKKPVVKKVAAKRTTTAKTPAKTKPVAKASKTKLPSAISTLATATVEKQKARKADKAPTAGVTVKFSALPKNSMFKLGGRAYVKNFQGKALLLPPSVNVTKGDVKISFIHVMATEVVTIKAGELVARI